MSTLTRRWAWPTRGERPLVVGSTPVPAGRPAARGGCVRGPGHLFGRVANPARSPPAASRPRRCGRSLRRPGRSSAVFVMNGCPGRCGHPFFLRQRGCAGVEPMSAEGASDDGQQARCARRNRLVAQVERGRRAVNAVSRKAASAPQRNNADASADASPAGTVRASASVRRTPEPAATSRPASWSGVPQAMPDRARQRPPQRRRPKRRAQGIGVGERQKKEPPLGPTAPAPRRRSVRRDSAAARGTNPGPRSLPSCTPPAHSSRDRPNGRPGRRRHFLFAVHCR